MTVSTIDRTQPVVHSPGNSAPVRDNFGAAANDIDALWVANAVIEEQLADPDAFEITAEDTDTPRSLSDRFGGWIDPKDWGALADDNHDDTQALRDSITEMLATGKVLILNGTYKITDELPISVASDWEIHGFGVAKIKQYTANKSIFHVLDTPCRRFKIIGVMFDYASSQPSSNTEAICIAFSATGADTFGNSQGHFEDLTFEHCFRSVAIHPDSTSQIIGLWGCRFINLNGYSTRSGGTFRLRASASGAWPNNRFEKIYMRCDAQTEAEFDLYNYDNTTFDNIEFNILLDKRAMILEGCRAWSIRGIRFESCSMTTEANYWLQLTGSTTYGEIRNIEIQTLTINVTNHCYFARVFSGAVVDIAHLAALSITKTSGDMWMGAALGATDGLIKIGNLGAALPAGILAFNQNDTNTPNLVLFSNSDIYNFHQDSVAASQTTVNLETDGSAVKEYLFPEAVGYIARIDVYLDGAVAAGQLDIEVYKNGAPLATVVKVTMTSGQTGKITRAPQNIGGGSPQATKLVRGDRISLRVTTNGAFSPTPNLIATLEVAIS